MQTLMYKIESNNIYIITFTWRFYLKRLIQAIQFYFIGMYVPWELSPQLFALLKQCSTTEPQKHTHTHIRGVNVNAKNVNTFIYFWTNELHLTPTSCHHRSAEGYLWCVMRVQRLCSEPVWSGKRHNKRAILKIQVFWATFIIVYVDK